MAIKNLTDRQTIKPRLPRIGKLRKGGEMVETGKKDKLGKDIKKYGPDLNHFRFTSDNPDVLSAFHSVYGDNPQFINVITFYDTVEENFPSWIECWDASGLLFRSDGENWVVWREGSEYKRGKKPHIDHEDQFEVGRFEFLIPELLHLGFVGTITMETHSNHDLRNITAVLMAAENQRSLKGASFVLRRVEQEISAPGWGDRSDKRSIVKKWLVRLEAPRQMFAGLLEAPGVEYETEPELLMIEGPEDLQPAQEIIITSTSEPATTTTATTPAATTTTTETTTTPKYPPRPWDAETLRNYMEVKAAELGNGGEASLPERRKLAVISLAAICKNDEAKRHAVTRYLFGQPSTKALTKGQVESVIKWVGLDNAGLPNVHAITEVEAVARAAGIDAGQLSLEVGK